MTCTYCGFEMLSQDPVVVVEDTPVDDKKVYNKKGKKDQYMCDNKTCPEYRKLV